MFGGYRPGLPIDTMTDVAGGHGKGFSFGPVVPDNNWARVASDNEALYRTLALA